MSLDYFVQIVGIIGCILGVLAYLSKNDVLLKSLIGVASFVMSYHFFLLGAFVGTGAAAMTGIRCFLSIFHRARPFAPLFFAAYIPLGYFCIQDWLDVLPLIAGVTGTYAMFYLEKLPMRYMLFITTFFWFLHNVLQGSIGGSILELFYISANIVTITRLRRAEAEDAQKEL